jgi:Uncharacterized conserved protein (DUF2190)
MSNPIQSVNYVAEAAISVNRLVKFGSGDRSVLQAAAATDAIIGVVNELSVVAGERVDVVRQGIPWVEAGAAITRGAPITSDGVGRAVTAAPAAGANVRIVGFADESASAAGDVIRFVLEPGFMQG